MRFLAFLIIASVILSLARALTLVLVLILAVSLTWAVLTRPLELLGFVTLMLLSQTIAASPLAAIIAIAGVAALIVLRKPKAAKAGMFEPQNETTRHKIGGNSA